MTREQAIAHGKEQLEVFGGEHREFIEMAIKALEQEPIYDELRAEITTLQNRCYALTKGVMCRFCKYECEYKAETEADNA